MSNNELEFNIIGEAHAQERPRFRAMTSKSGKTFVQTYDPQKSKRYKVDIGKLAKAAMEEQGWELTELPLLVSLKIYKSLTQTERKSKKFMSAFEAGLVRPITKPDVDNVAKAVLDGLTGVVYKDDKQVVGLTVSKQYTASEPLVTVRIKVWGC